MRYRPLLLALPVLFGLLYTAALAQVPPEEVMSDAQSAPIAPGEALSATLDELKARVQWLSQGAEAATQITEALVASSQRLLKAEKTIGAAAAALGQQLAAARDHLAELEAVRAADVDRIAQLQAELEDARAEARVLGERLEANEQVFEQLNAALAGARAESPKAVEAGGGEADRHEAAGAGPCNRSIEVESGDTLFKIARRCETTVDVLMEANPNIKDPNLLWAGQQIALPAQMQSKQPD